MNQLSIIIDQLDVTDVTFMLTLTYDDNGVTKDAVVYTDTCAYKEVEVEVTQ